MSAIAWIVGIVIALVFVGVWVFEFGDFREYPERHEHVDPDD